MGDHFRAGTLGVVLGAAIGGTGIQVELDVTSAFRSKAQEFGADEGAVLGFELTGEVLNEGVVVHFAFVVMGGAGSVLETGEHEHAGSGAADETHAPHTTAERGGETEGQLFVINTIEIGTGSEDSLAAIETLFEEFDRALRACFYLLFCHIACKGTAFF